MRSKRILTYWLVLNILLTAFSVALIVSNLTAPATSRAQRVNDQVASVKLDYADDLYDCQQTNYGAIWQVGVLARAHENIKGVDFHHFEDGTVVLIHTTACDPVPFLCPKTPVRIKCFSGKAPRPTEHVEMRVAAR